MGTHKDLLSGRLAVCNYFNYYDTGSNLYFVIPVILLLKT